jgi:hypothetical protein
MLVPACAAGRSVHPLCATIRRLACAE